MPESLAVRRAGMSTAVTRVHKVLESFAARDHNGEILTAVRHFPAREAQWADFPAWVHADLASAYAAKGIRRRRKHLGCRLFRRQRNQTSGQRRRPSRHLPRRKRPIWRRL